MVSVTASCEEYAKKLQNEIDMLRKHPAISADATLLRQIALADELADSIDGLGEYISEISVEQWDEMKNAYAAYRTDRKAAIVAALGAEKGG